MKIGLYLQDVNKNKCNKKIFDKAMMLVKKSDIDLLVFPEACYVPFGNLIHGADLFSEESQDYLDACIELSRESGRAVIVSDYDKFGDLFSVFSNAFAKKDETRQAIYLKHTMTECSAFDYMNYKEALADNLFAPVKFKGRLIGMTICYDCNHSLFSAVYGIQGVDIIINSTGGNVVYDKWNKYNRVRSLENKCFSFVTMGYAGDYKKKNSYVYGFSPRGAEMTFRCLGENTSNRNEIGKIYVYDTDDYDRKYGADELTLNEQPEEVIDTFYTIENGYEPDPSLNQSPTVNKKQNYYLPTSDIEAVLKKFKKIDENLYSHSVGGFNLIFVVMSDLQVAVPELVLEKLYSPELKKISDKRYCIVVNAEHISKDYFNNFLSSILKVRAMENFCAVVIYSDNFNVCYQCGMNRTAQVVKSENGLWGLDFNRMTGPEAIWKNKPGMREAWRENFEWLIQKITKT